MFPSNSKQFQIIWGSGGVQGLGCGDVEQGHLKLGGVERLGCGDVGQGP